MNMLNPDISIDFGSWGLRMILKGRGIVINEPSILAARDRKVVAIGREAKRMTGRTGPQLTLKNPFAYGRVADYPMADHMVTAYIKRISTGKVFLPNACISMSSGLTEVERRALQDIVETAGIRKINFVAETAAALLGAGADPFNNSASVIADFGASKTSIAAYSGGNVLAEKTLRVGGNDMDTAIIRMIKKKFNVEIGPLTAEEMKLQIGCASPMGKLTACSVRGRDVRTNLPKSITVTSDDMVECLAGICGEIVEAIIDVLADLPIAALQDVAKTGITLTGGVSRLHGLDELIRRRTKLDTFIPERPELAVVNGVAIASDLLNRSARKTAAVISAAE